MSCRGTEEHFGALTELNNLSEILEFLYHLDVVGRS